MSQRDHLTDTVLGGLALLVTACVATSSATRPSPDGAIAMHVGEPARDPSPDDRPLLDPSDPPCCALAYTDPFTFREQCGVTGECVTYDCALLHTGFVTMEVCR